jgi:hypothetical protein
MAGWLSERARNGGVDEIPLPAGHGRLFLCGKHYIGPDAEAALERAGAAIAVCLTERYELEARYPDYVAWLDGHATSKAIWYPIADLHAPSAGDLAELVARVRARLDAGDGVIVHCGAGIGRAGTLAAALLMSLGAGHDDALAAVRAARPGAGPQTLTQDLLLAEYARLLG